MTLNDSLCLWSIRTIQSNHNNRDAIPEQKSLFGNTALTR